MLRKTTFFIRYGFTFFFFLLHIVFCVISSILIWMANKSYGYEFLITWRVCGTYSVVQPKSTKASWKFYHTGISGFWFATLENCSDRYLQSFTSVFKNIQHWTQQMLLLSVTEWFWDIHIRNVAPLFGTCSSQLHCYLSANVLRFLFIFIWEYVQRTHCTYFTTFFLAFSPNNQFNQLEMFFYFSSINEFYGWCFLMQDFAEW